MFDWLDAEIATIRTRRFHRVDGPDSDAARFASSPAAAMFPPSYVAFVRRYGRARLYRVPGSDAYNVAVAAPPQFAESEAGVALLDIGGYDDQTAYFKADLLTTNPGAESPVFEWTGLVLRKYADTFAGWLAARAKAARRTYSKREWADVLAEPLPFTEAELAVVAARRRFRWRVIGISANGDLRYEVTNESDRTLTFLSVGVRSRSGDLHGGVRLSVGHIRPGETAVVEMDTYKSLVDPHDVEAYPLPDPDPEERERYWEFR